MNKRRILSFLVVAASICAMTTWILNALHLWNGSESILIKLAGNTLILLLFLVVAMPVLLKRLPVSEIHLVGQHQSLISAFVFIFGTLATLTAPLLGLEAGWVEITQRNHPRAELVGFSLVIMAMIGNSLLGLKAKRNLEVFWKEWSAHIKTEKKLRERIQTGETARKLLASMDGENTSFLIPAYNEEESIGQLVRKLKRCYPKARILVVDNNSDDRTSEVAKSNGATVIFEQRQGKAYAFRKGLQLLQKEEPKSKIIMLDADYTYLPQDASLLIDQSEASGANIVIGSRIKGVRSEGSISFTNMLGNHFLSLIARILYRSPVSDICSGYWVFSPKAILSIVEMDLSSEGFSLEAELVARCLKSEMTISEVPIRYVRRQHGSSHLKVFRDGMHILFTLLTLAIRNPATMSTRVPLQE